MDPVVLKRFETPDEIRDMPKGRFEIVRLGGVTIGRATYQPGWKWSVDAGPGVGADRCTIEHVAAAFAASHGQPLLVRWRLMAGQTIEAPA